MKIVIEGFYGGKIQVFSSKLKKTIFGWLYRATYKSFKNGFAKSLDVPDISTWGTVVKVPGPLDVRLSGTVTGDQIAVDYSVEPDGYLLSLYSGSIALAYGSKKKFKAKAFGNTIEGEIRIEQ